MFKYLLSKQQIEGTKQSICRNNDRADYQWNKQVPLNGSKYETWLILKGIYVIHYSVKAFPDNIITSLKPPKYVSVHSVQTLTVQLRQNMIPRPFRPND